LPDGIFSKQESKFGQTLEGLAKQDFGTFYEHLVFLRPLVYFIDIWYILWIFGIFGGSWVYFAVIWYIFSHFGILHQEQSGNPGLE
jgi:hypothetical protein